jgi:hypothetical protein
MSAALGQQGYRQQGRGGGAVASSGRMWRPMATQYQSRRRRLRYPIVNRIPASRQRLTPLALATSSPNTTVVKSDAPWKNLEEFIADAKKNPGRITYGSAGPGTTPHFIGELVKLKTGIDMTHVPLGSESAAATAVLGGHVNIAFLTLGTTRSHIEAGTMRALAVASNRWLVIFKRADDGRERLSGTQSENLGLAPAKTCAWRLRLAAAIGSLKDTEAGATSSRPKLDRKSHPAEFAVLADEEQWTEAARSENYQ